MSFQKQLKSLKMTEGFTSLEMDELTGRAVIKLE